MLNSLQDYLDILPFLILGLGIVIATFIEMFSAKSERILPWFSLLVLLGSAVFSINTLSNTTEAFGGMLAVGGNPGIFNFLFNIGASLVVLNSVDYIKKYGAYFGEYYILILTSVLGMMLMAGAKDLFVIFLGLELMSVCFYVLAGINRRKNEANEASMKYFLLGSFATGFIVYGIALIYGTTQSTSIDNIIMNYELYNDSILFYAGMLLFFIGFSFKIAAFPFHMWVPDVYQGSATTVTSLMSTGGKAAAFSVLLITMISMYFENLANTFMPYFAVISILSMFYGSIVAIAQNNLKRMLAYSSISHAGYMVIGLAAGNFDAFAGITFYLLAYTFMNIGAFGVISMIEGENDTNLDITNYAGLNNRNPLLAALLALFMFALSGLPPFAGFFGKYYVFISAVKADLTWLAILGVISSAISVYFYLRVVVFMYFKGSETELAYSNSKYTLVAVIVAAVFVLLLGIYPGSMLNMILAYLR